MMELFKYDPSLMIYGTRVPLYVLLALITLFGFLFLGWGQPPHPPHPLYPPPPPQDAVPLTPQQHAAQQMQE